MEKVLISAFVAVESAHAFSAFCPSVFTIKSLAKQSQEGMNQIRQGYAPAIIFALALGFVVSKLVKDWMPIFFSVATIVFMVIAYEWALRS